MQRINFWGVFAILLIVSFYVVIAGDEDCDSCYSAPVMTAKFFVVGMLFVGAAFYYSRAWASADSLLYRIARQPISPAGYCADGMPAQVYGAIKAGGRLLESPYMKAPCVFYHYIKEQFVKTKDSSHWEVIENKSDFIGFDVADKSGSIGISLRNIDSVLGGYKLPKIKGNKFIDYSNSEVDAIKLCFHAPVAEEKQGIIFRHRAECRVSEYALTEGQNVFVNGWVYSEDGRKLIAEHEETPLIISRKTKEAYLEDFAKGDNFFYTSNFIFLIGGAILFLLANYLFKIPFEYVIIIFLIVLFRIIYSIYNRIVALLQRCRNSESQIMIELKKRADLVPMLENIAKAYAKYEKTLMELIANMRAGIRGEEFGQKFSSYLENEGKTKTLFGIIENYPKLRANEVFLDFAYRLKIIEDNIAYFRGFYNKTVLKYNTLIMQFPFIVIAKVFRCREKEFLKAIE